ncbi:hypothetical protein A2G06_16630 (plasmid) [Geobacter anodireducens]|nr:hypothetical protein A2G06_16630 [Geobacter anodireducens]
MVVKGWLTPNSFQASMYVDLADSAVPRYWRNSLIMKSCFALLSMNIALAAPYFPLLTKSFSEAVSFPLY